MSYGEPETRGSGRAASAPSGSVRMKRWAIGVSAALIAMISIVPTSLASWSGTATLNAGTIDSGTLDAAVAAGTTTPTTETTADLGSLTAMLPGESRGSTFTVRNIGTANMTLAAATGPGAHPSLSFDISPGVCAPEPTPGTPLTASAVAVSGVIPPGTNQSFCLRITLASDIPSSAQNTSLGGYTIALTAASTT
jgi:hypothetical protein